MTEIISLTVIQKVTGITWISVSEIGAALIEYNSYKYEVCPRNEYLRAVPRAHKLIMNIITYPGCICAKPTPSRKGDTCSRIVISQSNNAT